MFSYHFFFSFDSSYFLYIQFTFKIELIFTFHSNNQIRLNEFAMLLFLTLFFFLLIFCLIHKGTSQQLYFSFLSNIFSICSHSLLFFFKSTYWTIFFFIGNLLVIFVFFYSLVFSHLKRLFLLWKKSFKFFSNVIIILKILFLNKINVNFLSHVLTREENAKFSGNYLFF